MSEELKVFYKAYAAWLDAGAVNKGAFWRDCGLCTCIVSWTNDDEGYELLNEMKSQFTAAGLSDRFPFNVSDEDYAREHLNSAMHLNEDRVAWVRKHVEIH
ncbi:hypothetical protein OPT79_43 [Klebsiella phage vB_KpnD_Opt-79]|uniref:Uncharacterized protein n=1 Tax=Escherichia phage vB_EcoD_Sadiya TaxID=2902684 RepID=A0AC61TRH9_9CAUD|nr:hypothetical protein OPT719_43 [Escherichia phage vB_EcoD_Opt-719]UGO52811.1 hypothetical protein OPT79_43 [Klebsiella phage vB_KpnD_Opt-79]UGV22565.1 hypothetical protein PHLEASOLO_43 [Escherichia phage vB_ EcoD_Phleasolo]UGV22733.1 hypothetical protein SADIYA_44 [Escherichia phage vB_EcoD_Sadiya]